MAATKRFSVRILTLFTVCNVLYSEESGVCDLVNTTYNCSGRYLTKLPPQDRIPSGIKQLDLSGNHLRNISFLNHTTVLKTLEVLILKDNRISFLADDSFGALSNLEVLDLSGNSLEGKNLESAMFSELLSLRSLNMERNPMFIVKEGLFDFYNLPKIEDLDLSHCLLEDIQDGGIDLPKLLHLDLSWNKLTVFHPDSFRMLVDLRTLDLSHNHFKFFEQVPFLPEIRTINLDSNSIETVNISNAVWQFADSLERLYIRHNNIIRFTRDSFPLNLDTLVEVRLDNNRIVCDCKMRWFKEQKYDFTDRNISIPCQFPVELRGLNIIDVDSSFLTCSAPLWEILLLCGLTTVGLVVCLMSLYLVVQKKCKRKHTRKPNNSTDRGGDYTAVFTRDDDDVRVSINDNKSLLQSGTEFDV